MYQVSVRQHFDAAHYLRHYQGKCENMHGHRFEVVVALQSETLDEAGMAFDFTVLKRILGEVMDRLDHKCLNEVTPFNEINPSSENIAAYLYQQIRPGLESSAATVSRIEVWESPECCATYIP